jgi:hypothetical protein
MSPLGDHFGELRALRSYVSWCWVLGAGGNINENEVAIRAVFLHILAGDAAHDFLSIGGNLRVGDGDDLFQVVQLYTSGLGGGGRGEKKRRQ